MTQRAEKAFAELKSDRKRQFGRELGVTGLSAVVEVLVSGLTNRKAHLRRHRPLFWRLIAASSSMPSILSSIRRWHSGLVQILPRLHTLVVFLAFLAHTDARAQILAPLGPLDDGVVTYFIADPVATAEARAEDKDLAVWAIEAWQRAAGGALKLVPAASESDALVRLYWVPASGGQYGEMRPLELQGRRGAAVYIRPDTRALGPDIAAAAGVDALFRDTIVYLTCVHELGHALGLSHTANFADIMYFFGFGGDIEEFFGRYRRTLGERGDIRGSSGLSPGDLEQLRALYAAVPRQVTAAN